MNNRTALITGSYGGLGTCFVNIHAAQKVYDTCKEDDAGLRI